jgi:hypothetical protein
MEKSEDHLVLESVRMAQQRSLEKITRLPEVRYGLCQTILEGLDLEEVTGQAKKIRFIDLQAYRDLGFLDPYAQEHLKSEAAGILVNPQKTGLTDPLHLYIAVTPSVTGSILIHEVAHVLDLLGGSGITPEMTYPLQEKTGLPMEHLEHPQEFGDYLILLRDRFKIELDAEDTIVAFLAKYRVLIPAAEIKKGDPARLKEKSAKILMFLQEHREEITRLIQDRERYILEDMP